MAPARPSGPRRPETLLHLSSEPVFLLGPAGGVLYVNPAWEDLTGVPAAEFVRREADAAPGVPPDLLDAFRPPPEAVAGAPASTTVLIRRPDGQRAWRRLEFWPHRDREGRPLFLLGVARPADQAPIAPDSPSMRLRAELWRVREQLADRLGLEALIGRGPAHRRLLDQVEAASACPAPTLILGPPGSGKRQVARAIRKRSGRPDSSLLVIDCAALPAELVDRELFGPPSARPDGGDAPRLAPPEGSTVLLGEILALPRDVQARLAVAIADPDSRGVRLLSTTSGDPEAAVRDDRLRADLYFALTTMVIRLSPLRERLDELPLLAQHFLERSNQRDVPRRVGFRPEAVEVLVRYDWPGNLRELSRVVDASHDRSSDDLIGPDDLPASIRGHLGAAYLPPPTPEEHLPLDATLERLERRLIERALKLARGNKSLAAKKLHISRTRLHRRIHELGLGSEPEPDATDGEQAVDPVGD
ncbi:sigma 54-interacting transcriptional regulator [Tautonia plasticadhaerens]|uniref:Transcriptional regulatory protein ZraR n=1 Tax=Tautonia plasticadhaerens TaxID=2527974 RepID=A0A518HAQ2_9BACT|nr:sigma 54-interacting transcriptional regulator [Tautonia plasticadhaerens]QDV37836.1 Transcriptional regulatory protein ZraR [Tautonia plasticadhaerens]